MLRAEHTSHHATVAKHVLVWGCAQRWQLLHPKHTHLLYDRFKHEMAPHLDLDPQEASRFPNLALARQLAVEVIQVGVCVRISRRVGHFLLVCASVV